MDFDPLIIDSNRLPFSLEIVPGKVRNPRLRGHRLPAFDQGHIRLDNPFNPNEEGEVVQVWVPGLEGTMAIDEWAMRAIHHNDAITVENMWANAPCWQITDPNTSRIWHFWPETGERDHMRMLHLIWGGLFEVPQPKPVQLVAKNVLHVKRNLEL